ncbi:MAG: hypothetical protein HUU48_05225 [Flavobacteriales bacterium]|nr:hypothetical protein [Flavobacteriales bacterium]
MKINAGIQEIIVATLFVTAVLYLFKRFVLGRSRNKCSDCSMNRTSKKE